MTNREMYMFQAALQNVSELPGNKFAYAVAKNLARLEAAIAALGGENEHHPDENQFESKRMQICDKYCERDELGHPVVQNGVFQGLNGNAAFDKEIDELQKAFPQYLEFKQEQRSRRLARLEEQADIVLHTVRVYDLPPGITATQLTGILPMVVEE